MNDQFGLEQSRMLNDPRGGYGPRVMFERDGNMICAHLDDFINLQESPAGFGKTMKEAVVELLLDRKLSCRKAMWFGYGGPAGLCGKPAYSDEIHPNCISHLLEKELARCPNHGGWSAEATASLAIFYRTVQTNRLEALDWEEEATK